jgi:2-keto-4-pentenoate hydratase/2-oxohepta-3-ene-1,7-dioic acid hydratase in catechol pathway
LKNINKVIIYIWVHIFSFEIIAFISRYFTLKTGDINFTGTPAGVAAVKIGDTLTAFVEGEKMLEFEVK